MSRSLKMKMTKKRKEKKRTTAPNRPGVSWTRRAMPEVRILEGRGRSWLRKRSRRRRVMRLVISTAATVINSSSNLLVLATFSSIRDWSIGVEMETRLATTTTMTTATMTWVRKIRRLGSRIVAAAAA
jgi:hypothetical protein